MTRVYQAICYICLGILGAFALLMSDRLDTMAADLQAAEIRAASAEARAEEAEALVHRLTLRCAQ